MFDFISSNIHHYFLKVITTETFNIDFLNKFIKFWIILFFQLFILSDLFPYLLPYIDIHTYRLQLEAYKKNISLL